MATDKQIEKIIIAIEGSAYKWRTVRGIVKDSKVPLLQVERFLNKSEVIVKARKPNSKGHALYTTREKLDRESSLLNKVFAKLLNTASVE